MVSKIRAILLSLTLIMASPLSVFADGVTDAVNDVAAKLVQQLPMDKKIALKSLSPDETGLPENFLQKLTSDLEAALLTASEFEINRANRATMEDVWQEAVEFNNANFDELFKSANADVMMIISPRAISSGVEISVTAYALNGDNVGKILASSGSVVLPIDLQANLGVDVNDLNKQMAQVLAEIEKVGQTGGLISNPNTYAEFYHNARLLQQRGETDLAMRNYEQALAEGYLFVDPLLDLLDLANARYGKDGSKTYFEKKIKDNIPSELRDFGALLLGGDPMNLVQPILDKKLTFSPLLATWLMQTYDTRFDTLTVGKAKGIAAELISSDYTSGRFQTFYVDKIRGATIGQNATKIFESMLGGGQRMKDWFFISRASTYFTSFDTTKDSPPFMRDINIQDPVDASKPIIFCGRAYDNEHETCKQIDPSINVLKNSETGWFTYNNGLDWTVGMHCATRVSYTDKNGFEVTSPVLIGHEERRQYMPNDIEKIIECAGDYYRAGN